MNIVALKLTSGEEVIAMKRIDGSYSKPRVIQMVHTQNGVQAGLVPWILSNPDETVRVNQSAILAEVDVVGDVEKSYLQQTSTLDLSTKLN
jgi:hypothetical protein